MKHFHLTEDDLWQCVALVAMLVGVIWSCGTASIGSESRR